MSILYRIFENHFGFESYKIVKFKQKLRQNKKCLLPIDGDCDINTLLISVWEVIVLFYTIATIIISIISVILIVAIVLQQGKSAGLSSSLAGSSETFWAKSKSKTKEGKLEKITTVAGIIFFILAILLNVGMFTK